MTPEELRSPKPPLHPIRFSRWLWRLTLDIIDEYRSDGVGDLAASITFWTLLSIPAAVLALVCAVSTLEPLVGTSVSDDVRSSIEDFVRDTFANSTALNDAVAELFANSNAGIVTFAIAVAVFSLSRGFAGMIRALDEAYTVDEGRAWWHVRLVAIAMGLGTIVVVAVAATLLAVLPELPGGTAAKLLTGPAAFVLLTMWAATLFHVAPYHRTPWRYDFPGAVVTAVGWVIATQGFALYVRKSGSANEVQTFVGAILLGLTLMYLLSIIMLVGAELNDVISRRAGVVQQPVSWRERGRRLRDRVGDVIDDHQRREGDQTEDPSQHPTP